MEICGREGMKLEEHELDVWARANTHAKAPLGKEDLRALAMEHTVGKPDSEANPVMIPLVDFPRAEAVLEHAIGYYKSLRSALVTNSLRRSRGRQNSDEATVLARLETDIPMGIARDMQEAIRDGREPTPSADNSAA
ncbi:MAG TPA: hypothetical protein VFK11_03660 [Candidatus Saccharimonadales bacterium]|nr:hypothetical protein [Candidatus Saccharimonadales bacterium]